MWRHSGLIVHVLHIDLYQEVSVRAVLGDIAFGSWARHFIPTVPLSIQVYKWVTKNLMPGTTLQWNRIPSRGDWVCWQGEGLTERLIVPQCHRNWDNEVPHHL